MENHGGEAAGAPQIVTNVDGATMRAMYASSSSVAAQIQAEYQDKGMFTRGEIRSSVATTPRHLQRRLNAPPGFPVHHNIVIPSLPPPPTVPALFPYPAIYAGQRSRAAPQATTQETQIVAQDQGPVFSTMEPNVVYVKQGEDVLSKIMDYCLSGFNSLLSIYVLSAVGYLSRATLGKNPSSTTHETIEGCMEIIYVSGSYNTSRVSGERSIMGELNIKLAKGDNKVIAGSVSGPLIAESLVQVVLGSIRETV